RTQRLADRRGLRAGVQGAPARRPANGAGHERGPDDAREPRAVPGHCHRPCLEHPPANKPFEMLGAMMGSDLWTRVGGPNRNLMRLFFHPNGIKPYVSNWAAIAPLLWHRAQREAEALGGEEMKLVLSELSQYQDAETLWAAEDAALVPVLPLEVEKD